MMRHAKGSAVSGRSPRKVYLRGSAVVASVKVTGACGFVATYLLAQGVRGGWTWPLLPDCSTDGSVVDVPANPTLIKCDDLKNRLNVSSLRREAGIHDQTGDKGEDEDGKKNLEMAHRINFPLVNVLFHNLGNEIRVPPHLWVVLEVGMVEGDASLSVNA